MATETEAAFDELLDIVAATHRRMADQLTDDETTLLEAHKWLLSILQVAADVNLWADTARPRFVEIVGPYKKWGGDNADAFYCFAPIDPARTYRVTRRTRRRRLPLAHRLRRTRRRSLLRADRGRGEQPRRRSGDRMGPSTSCCHPRPRRRRRLDPARARRRRGDHPRLPRGPGARAARRLAHRGRRTRRHASARTTPTWPVASAPWLTWVREQASIVPLPLGHAQHHRPAVPGADHDLRLGRRRRRLRHGRASSSPTTRRWSSGAARPSASSGTCACGTRSSTPTTTTTSASPSTAPRWSTKPDGSWTIVVAPRRARPPELGLDGRPPTGPHLVPLVPARRDTRANPRSGVVPVASL